MRVINNCARLITVNIDGKKYKLLPAGSSVEIPDEEAEGSGFLKTLIKDGSVKVLESDASAEKEDLLADLRQEAKDLGVEGVTKNWGEKKLRAAIEEKKDDSGEE